MSSLADLFSGPQAPSEELEQSHTSLGSRRAERRLRETAPMLQIGTPESTDLSMEERQRQRSFSFQHVGGMAVIANLIASSGPLTEEETQGALLQNVQPIGNRPPHGPPSQALEKSLAVLTVRDLIHREDALAIRKPLGVLPISISNIIPLSLVGPRRRVIFGGELAPLLPASNLIDAPAELAIVALRQAQEEVFEYGSESELARTLSALIVATGADGVRAIESALASSVVTDETASETLRHLGALNDPRTRTARLRILERHLRSKSPRRRYAAAVGLSDMNVPEALALLEAAIEQEPTEELKRRFRRFIALLPHP